MLLSTPWPDVSCTSEWRELRKDFLRWFTISGNYFGACAKTAHFLALKIAHSWLTKSCNYFGVCAKTAHFLELTTAHSWLTKSGNYLGVCAKTAHFWCAFWVDQKRQLFVFFCQNCAFLKRQKTCIFGWPEMAITWGFWPRHDPMARKPRKKGHEIISKNMRVTKPWKKGIFGRNIPCQGPDSLKTL